MAMAPREKFIEEMNLRIESAVERKGYEDDDGDRVPIMRAYEKAVEILQGHYGKQKSMFVKGHKFLTAKQASGESDRDYLQRVESLIKYAEVANNDDRTSKIKMKLAKVPEFDSCAHYQSGGRDRSYDSEGKFSPKSSPKSGRRYYGNTNDERDVYKYGARNREYSKDRDNRRYRDDSRDRDKGGDVGYDRQGSSRGLRGNRDSSYERYGSRDNSREKYRGRESPREGSAKLSRYRGE
ncbi:serine/threonine-protein kinase prpf4B-like [Watersipora subatra]|uniref:serine/threonine-protein kinase prpf4B-like n=1 Tax=Watersipora subatra TaxID=2589382 RepID=UPI00355C581F